MLFVQQAKVRKSGICHCKQHVIPYNKCLPSQFLADGCYHLIANGLCDPGDEGMPCFQQWFCLPSWVFPVCLWVGHWLLTDVCLICSLILCKTFPDSLLDFHFFIQTFPQDFDLLMEKDEGKFYRVSPASDGKTSAQCGSGFRLQGKGYSCLQPCVSGVNSSRDLFVFLQESHSVTLRL